eukprot:CAMPEP_0168543452 /NCGR_PEP_ID=MMETSP0413-20121227/1890_1 /TAXON_ID=136452 /ORGANISM="Filamoeba nolandi, Strain NC-AS-23-1" /LENGTH=1102 /DNA_ID=CAMNT_0008573399 /DNA_START=258 /DNA_END=3566 /DNA_ORIENTATION=-
MMCFDIKSKILVDAERSSFDKKKIEAAVRKMKELLEDFLLTFHDRNSQSPFKMITDQLDTILAQLQKPMFSVVVFGRTNAGKSTLLNNICSGSILPVASLECTSCVIELVYGDSTFYELVFHPGMTAKEILNLVQGFRKNYPSKHHLLISDEIVQFLKNHQETDAPMPFSFNQLTVITDLRSIDPELEELFYKLCSCVRVYSKNNLLKGGIRFVDTPGVDSNSTRTLLTQQYLLQEADMIMHVANYQHGRSQGTDGTLEQLLAANKPLFVIATSWDLAVFQNHHLVDGPDLLKRWKPKTPHVYFTGKDSDSFDLPVLRSELMKYLSEKKDHVIVRTNALQLQNLIKLFLETQINAPLSFLNKSAEERTHIVTSLTELSKSYKAQITQLHESLDKSLESIENSLQHHLQSRMADVIPLLEKKQVPAQYMEQNSARKWLHDEFIKDAQMHVGLLEYLQKRLKTAQGNIQPLFRALYEIVGKMSALLDDVKTNQTQPVLDILKESVEVTKYLDFPLERKSLTFSAILETAEKTFSIAYEAFNNALETLAKFGVPFHFVFAAAWGVCSLIPYVIESQRNWKDDYIQELRHNLPGVSAEMSKNVCSKLRSSWQQNILEVLKELEFMMFEPIRKMQARILQHSETAKDLFKKYELVKKECLGVNFALRKLVEKLDSAIGNIEPVSALSESVPVVQEPLRLRPSCIPTSTVTFEEAVTICQHGMAPQLTLLDAEKLEAVQKLNQQLGELLDQNAEESFLKLAQTPENSDTYVESGWNKFVHFATTAVKSINLHLEQSGSYLSARALARSTTSKSNMEACRKAVVQSKLCELVYKVPRKSSQVTGTSWKPSLENELENIGHSLKGVSTLVPNSALSVPGFMLCVERATNHLTIAIAGTATMDDALSDMQAVPTQNNRFHSGVEKAANEIYKELRTSFTDINKYSTIHLTGHSLGGGIAVVLAHLMLADSIPISSIVTFGAPLVLYQEVPSLYAKITQVNHFVNEYDIVPRLLGSKLLGQYAKTMEEQFGMNVTNENNAMSAIKNYVPFGVMWFIFQDENQFVISPIPDQKIQRQLLQACTNNVNFQSTRDHGIITYHQNIARAVTDSGES